MAAKIELAIRPVRVSIPASVAANIDRYKEAIKDVLGHLGCPACCSGHDIFFELQRDVVLQKDLRDIATAGVTPRGNVTKLASQNTLRVGIQPDIGDNIKDVFAALERVADISGHPACASGCDMFFQLERSLVLNEKLKITEQAITVANIAGI